VSNEVLTNRYEIETVTSECRFLCNTRRGKVSLLSNRFYGTLEVALRSGRGRFNMAVLQLYNIVNCKTCSSQINVEFVGPALNVRIAGTVTNPGHIRCVECGQSRNYTYFDIQLIRRVSR
jgi:hypothetical protein